MPFDRQQPYIDLPLLPPSTELETKAVLKQAIAASRMLANLRGLAAQIPNQGVLINSIVLQEARLSPSTAKTSSRSSSGTPTPRFSFWWTLASPSARQLPCICKPWRA